MCILCRRSRGEQLNYFFFNDTATTEIYTLSLHDALPISVELAAVARCPDLPPAGAAGRAARRLRDGAAAGHGRVDRKSTRLNSSHANISYAVFCLKKKNESHLRRVSRGAAHDFACGCAG